MTKTLLRRSSLDLSKHPWIHDIIPAPEPELKTPPDGKPIFVSNPSLARNEKKYLIECIDTNWISSKGAFIDKFEREFAREIGVRHAISCSSGTAALHLTFAAIGLDSRFEAIIPAFTMIATANTIHHTGAKIQLVDSDPDTWNMDIDQVESRINKSTKAIVAVHTYGIPVQMDRLQKLAKKHNLFLIEDAAEAHGAMHGKKRVGSLGDAACFSFYANKIITTGEGGMVTTNEPRLAGVVRTIRDHAFSPGRHFWHGYVGFNYRMTNMQAAIGYAQTEYFDELVEARIRNARLYRERLLSVKGIRFAPSPAAGKSVQWMFCITVEPEFGHSRDELRVFLADRGVETRTLFIPIHLQPAYFRDFEGQRFPVAESLCRKGLYLPTSATLTTTDIDYICDCIAAARKKRR